MSTEDQTAPGEQTQETSGSENINNESAPKDDVIPYATYKKALNEKKNVQTQLQELQDQIAKAEQDKKLSEGKKDEVIDELRSQINELSGKLKSKEQNYAWSTVTSKIREAAIREGCANPDKLIRLMDDNDLKSIGLDENFNVDAESLQKVIEKNKKENYFLFSNSNKKIADGVPGTKEPAAKPQSEEEILDSYVKNLKY